MVTVRSAKNTGFVETMMGGNVRCILYLRHLLSDVSVSLVP